MQKSCIDTAAMGLSMTGIARIVAGVKGDGALAVVVSAGALDST